MDADRSEIPSMRDITRLLAEFRSGRRQAFDELFPILYEQLHTLAHRVRCRIASDTLGTTALVHEAYLKLGSSSALNCEDRRHFFAVAARAMRQIVLDHSREVLAEKRGGLAIHVSLDGIDVAIKNRAHQLVQLDEALNRLSFLDPNLARVVELRFFAGLTVEDTSEVLQKSSRTVKRDWRRARAFLLLALQSEEPVGGGAAT